MQNILPGWTSGTVDSECRRHAFSVLSGVEAGTRLSWQGEKEREVGAASCQPGPPVYLFSAGRMRSAYLSIMGAWVVCECAE